MINALKPYATYKETSQTWLGRVPAHWEVRRLGAVLRERGETNAGGAIADVLSLTRDRGVIPYADKGNIGNKKSDDITRYKIVRPNDIVVNCMNVIIGSVGISSYTGCLSPVYYVLTQRTPEDVPGYLNAYFQTKPFQRSLVRIGNGILAHRMRIPMELLKCEPFPVPPPEEQSAIVRFLNWSNSRIDRAISAKRKIIGLLNEQEQAIIRRVVTRGLISNSPLKSPGIHWLHEIPSHWKVRKMKSLVSTTGGMTPSKAVESYWDGHIPWVSPKDMKVREIHDSQDHISEAALKGTAISLIDPPAVLIVVRGMILARAFPCAVTAAPVTINQDMKALRTKAALDPHFLVSLLTGIQHELLELVEIAGHGTRCLRTDSWENFTLPVPPLSEQMKINDFLKRELQAFEASMRRAEREIDLLHEYRARLMVDVVTGQLDVRGLELPELQAIAEESADDEGKDIQEVEEQVEPFSEEMYAN